MKKVIFILSGLLIVATGQVSGQDTTQVNEPKVSFLAEEELQAQKQLEAEKFEKQETINEVDMSETADMVEQDTAKKKYSDTTEVKIAKKKIKIVEEEDGTSVKITRTEALDHDIDCDFTTDVKTNKKQKKYFKGNWASMGVGINNFADKDYSFSRTEEYAYMDLNTGKSWFFSLNMAQFSVPIVSRKLGLVSGLGIDWNSYHFDGNNSIEKVNGLITNLPYTDTTLKKSKLNTAFFNAPIIIELQPTRKMFIHAGVVAGLKIYSNSKIVFEQDGDKRKEKNPDDFNINFLRLGATARIGYDDFAVFGTYYFTPFFETDKGPELYPVNIGLAVSF